MNFKIIVQYDGSRYQGWQKLGDSENTIQTKLEKILTSLEGGSVFVHGAGRTDAGVHASGQVANFEMMNVCDANKILTYLNQYLPEDIAVVSIESMPQRFHSRLNAVKKTYLYTIRNSEFQNVFRRKYEYQIPEELDMEAMKKGSELLTGTHDFLGFSSVKKSKKSTLRTLDEIRILKKDDVLEIYFTGDGFLHHMVRILTGTLIEIGLQKREVESIDSVFRNKVRSEAGYLVPAKGLTLLKVYY